MTDLFSKLTLLWSIVIFSSSKLRITILTFGEYV